jgi:hypothetical protein
MGSMKDHAYGDTPAPYPESPGYKREGPSKDAAQKTAGRAGELRGRVLTEIERAGFLGITADEVAAKLNETVLSVRPRLSELRSAEKIEPTGERRPNASGMTATVWRTK